MDYQQLFLHNRPILDNAVDAVARGHGLTAARQNELRQTVMSRLTEHDYDALRRFTGRSRLRTYFLFIAERAALDAERIARHTQEQDAAPPRGETMLPR